MSYDTQFYEHQKGGSERSARIVLPIVFDLLHPRSVIDFGCGVGTWLAVARELGAERVLGLDGEYVDRAQLRVAAGEFRAVDLARAVPVPGFDLALSLEVAEHLDEGAAARLVDALAGSADAVLFGAAIPGQRGHRHVNCQWQSWWARLFVERGYQPFDAVRPATWGHQAVEHHYAQNTLLYVRSGPRSAELATRLPAVNNLRALDLVHPEIYGYYLAKYWQGLHGLVRRWRARRE